MTPAELKAEIQTGPLAAELAPYIASGNDTAIADALNRRDITANGHVSSHDIRQYLMLVDLLLAIESSPAPACIAAKRALEVFPVFDLSNQMIFVKFSQVLDGLVAESLIPDFTEVHKATILGLASTTVSRAEIVLGQPVSVTDVAVALRG